MRAENSVSAEVEFRRRGMKKARIMPTYRRTLQCWVFAVCPCLRILGADGRFISGHCA